ncbi:MAG: hypothetical protein P4L40_08415 [Terracidiphilus sp.]|nr:hypothetical protein [Terracidiphilus sp.]
MASTVEKMLASVPPKYLNGLSEVVLTNTAGLPRKLRRSVTKSRGRKVRIVEARGLYHQAWHGKPAWIEIFVDNALGPPPGGWLRWLWLRGLFREGGLSEVVFHEIGHHIHATVRPEHREKEDVADVWKLRLVRNYFRQRHPILRRLFRIVLFAFGPLYRRFYRRTMEQGLAKGWMSRAEFDEGMK